jgi:hypothetical protein
VAGPQSAHLNPESTPLPQFRKKVRVNAVCYEDDLPACRLQPGNMIYYERFGTRGKLVR